MAACLAMSVTGAQAQSSQKPYKAYLVSDAHLDTQWNWDVQATIRDHIRHTLTQNLYLLDNYPDYKFNFEGAVKYWWMKEYYPSDFQRLKQYVKNGRWHLAGSSWDANETIICSPESWIRNILLGQTFYRQEFGTEGDDVFLPDCFGFGYDLPTLAAHCGLIGFSSQKLQWRTNPFYSDGKKYPYTVGLWKGIDGSQIMMVHGFDYAKRWADGEDLSQSKELIAEAKQSPLNTVYRYYGTGDIGGSPEIASVQAVERGLKGDGPVQIISATSDQIYHDFLPFDKHPELPVFDGELTMDVHGSGCYTSQAAMKLYNRQNEHLGDAAERSAVMTDWQGLTAYPLREMTANWHRMIWHQFHDDLPGTCIPRAYEFSWNDELLTLKNFSRTLTHSVSRLSERMDTRVGGTPLLVYNNESFPMKAVAAVDVTDGANYTVSDNNGKKVLSQVVTDTKGRRQLLFDATAPSAGLSVYSLKAGGKAQAGKPAQGSQIENSVYRVTVDAKGDISSILDKRYNKELVANGKALRLVVFDDCASYSWPAWEVQKATIDKAPVGIDGNVKVSIVEQGPLRSSLLIEKQYGESTIKQYVRLYEGSQADRIDFQNVVEWKSLNALLKQEFPFSVSNEKATYDLGLGSIDRGNNKANSYEVYSHEWTDLTDRSGSYGVTVINDSKYGWDKPNDNTLRLSLLYSPKVRNNYAYQSRQDLGHHEFTYSIIGHQGALNRTEAVEQSTVLNSPLRTFRAEGKHAGDLGKSFSFVSVDNPNVMIKTLKHSEVGNQYVVRLYELSGREQQTAHLTFADNIATAQEADGTEKVIGPATFAGKQLTVTIKPFSVKTFLFTLNKKAADEVKASVLSLPFDRKCASPNAFRGSADMGDGFSFASELLPDSIFHVDGVPFQLGPKDSFNGVNSRGNVITLPRDARYNRVYILAASNDADHVATFKVGKQEQQALVPYYSGFIGQWGHDGQTTGYLKNADVAWVGTHRHSSEGDEPYEFTYLYKIALDVPKGATQVTLPNDPHVVVFAATAVEENAGAVAAEPLFRTNNRQDDLQVKDGEVVVPGKENVLKGARLVSVSGETNDQEKAVNLIDGDNTTKWCDVSDAPNSVVFDLGTAQTVKGWHLLNAGAETPAYITRGCLLQGRNSESEEWQTLDILDDNSRNVVDRSFEPKTVRYVRLYVYAPEQAKNGNTARIYDFELYK